MSSKKNQYLLLGGFGVGILALNSQKSSAALPPVDIEQPVKSKEELFQNYKSAIRNVFENYNKISDDFNIETVLKFSQKIVDLGISFQPLKRYFTVLLSERDDIKIPNSSLTAKQIITNLETKLYKLYQ